MISEISSEVTDGVRINVRTRYVLDESCPSNNSFVFAYHIDIINESPYEFQVVEREWHIQNALGHKRIVKGEGVVGKKPFIQPKAQYSYISGVHFPTSIGRMYGYYRMLRLIDQAELQVKIPPFSLIVPFLQN